VEELERCTRPGDGRLIVMTTAISESMWPIPDVEVVVDTGTITRLRHVRPWLVDTIVQGLCLHQCRAVVGVSPAWVTLLLSDRISVAEVERRALCASFSQNAVCYRLFTAQVRHLS